MVIIENMVLSKRCFLKDGQKLIFNSSEFTLLFIFTDFIKKDFYEIDMDFKIFVADFLNS